MEDQPASKLIKMASTNISSSISTSTQFFREGPSQFPPEILASIQSLPTSITTVYLQEFTFTNYQLQCLVRSLAQHLQQHLTKIVITNCKLELVTSKELHEHDSLNLNQTKLELRIDLEDRALSKFETVGLLENLVHDLVTSNTNENIGFQSISIEDCFFHKDLGANSTSPSPSALAFAYLQPEQVNYLYLENVQVESNNLLNSLARCTQLRSVELKDLTLFGKITGNLSQWPNLRHYVIYVLQHYNPGFRSDDDEDPELLSRKLDQLLLFDPNVIASSNPALSIQVARRSSNEDDDDRWRFHFKSSKDGSKVTSGLNWTTRVFSYIRPSVLKELTLCNYCSIDVNLIPLQTLHKLTISGINIGSKQLSTLFQRIASSDSSVEHLTIKEHGPIQVNDLNSSKNLKALTLIQSKISTAPEHYHQSNPEFKPFPNLTSITLVDCNLNRDFTQVFEYNFRNLEQLYLKEFPVSCELLYKVLHEFPVMKLQIITTFDLQGSWEGTDQQTDEGYYKFLRDFLVQEMGIKDIDNCKRLELVKNGNRWVDSTGTIGFPAEVQPFDFDGDMINKEDDNVTKACQLGAFNNGDDPEVFSQFLSSMNQSPSRCEYLRAVKLGEVAFTYENLEFLQHCKNLISLELEYLKLVEPSDIWNVSQQLGTMQLGKLQLFKLGFSSSAIRLQEISLVDLEKLIWFSKSTSPSKLKSILGWSNTQILIEIGIKTLFEVNTQTGELNLRNVIDGSDLFKEVSSTTDNDSNNSGSGSSSPGFQFQLKSLSLRELNTQIPSLLQPSLESLWIHGGSSIDFNLLRKSIQFCTQLKELDMKDVKFDSRSIPKELGFLRHLEKMSYTKMGA